MTWNAAYERSSFASSGHRRIDHARLTGITKNFPGVLANDRVDFDVRAGEIHALLGENGAGKSTLMRQLYGLYKPDEGEIRLNDEVVEIRSPSDALVQGIGMIHQHFMLVPTLTVTENVALGVKGGPLLDLGRVRKRLLELAEVYGLKVDPDARVWQLSVGEQQRVEIVKALFHGGALIILDEPTAVLTPQEVDELFKTLKQMRDQGHALIFITHKLYEVQELSDRITVMRDGRVVDTIPNDGVQQSVLARMMVGRDVQFQPDRVKTEMGAVQLQIRNLCAQNDRGLPALQGVDLTVRAGEIVGVAGVSGNGQREMAECMAGLRLATDGEVVLAGHSLLQQSVQERLHSGLSFIPKSATATEPLAASRSRRTPSCKDTARRSSGTVLSSTLTPSASSRRV